MEAYASAELSPQAPEFRLAPVPSVVRTASGAVNGDASARSDGNAIPSSILASLILGGLGDHGLAVLARRLLPHLRQSAAQGSARVHVAYTVTSLAAELDVSQKTIRCAIARRELPAVKRGSRWIISADAVQAWATASDLRRGTARLCGATAPKAAGPSLRSVLCGGPSRGGTRLSVEKVKRSSGEVVWRVRWRQHGHNRARTFSTRRDAADFDAKVRRQRRAGSLAALDAGTETLGEYVTGAWAATHAATLAPKTRLHYASLYDHHLRPYLASIALRQISPETIGRWQADRLAAGAGPIAVRHAMDLLGSVLEHAFVAERIAENPVRRVKKARRPRREEVRALPPGTIEAMRSPLEMRDTTLISVLAYAGLRPGEALGLRWEDIRERTILVQRSISLGEEADTKTRQHRTVRLLSPLAEDLRAWRMAVGRLDDAQLDFPGKDGLPWTQAAYQSWRRRAFRRATHAAGLTHARPYDLRHSFASLLLHEGRSVIYVARQLGHDARLTLTRYGHVIDELDDAPRIEAEAAIAAARAAVGPRKLVSMREFGS